MKQASKRSLIAAALSAGRLSNIFSQDLEDTPIAKEHLGGVTWSDSHQDEDQRCYSENCHQTDKNLSKEESCSHKGYVPST